MNRFLVVTATDAESVAVLGSRTAEPDWESGTPVRSTDTPAGRVIVAVGGVGAVRAALCAARLLPAGFDLVLSAGISGGFAKLAPGMLVIGDSLVHADLGAETADGGFLALPDLGLGSIEYPVDQRAARLLQARLPAAVTGTIVTVSTVTGTQRGADRLARAHPGAAAEDMEGAGVAAAAGQAGVPFASIRAISNVVGPRDRESWRIGEALAALTAGCRAIFDAEWS